MIDHEMIMKYLMKKTVNDLILLYHVPTELNYKHNAYKIDDLRKETITYNEIEIEIVRLFIEVHDSKIFNQVGWVLNETIDHCMICQQIFTMFQYKHHCRVCGNIICHKSTCKADSFPIKDMTEYGSQIICKICKPYQVS